MDKNQLEEYKREMMRLYGRRDVPTLPDNVINEAYETLPEEPQKNEPTYDQSDIKPTEISETDSEAPDDTAWSDFIDNGDGDIDSRYPDPDISGLEDADNGSSDNEIMPDNSGDIAKDNDSNKVYIPNAQPPVEEMTAEAAKKSLGSSFGYILVNVRAGDESFAVDGAAVIITATVGGKRLLIASGKADNSGTTQRFKVPVPDVLLSQSPDPKKRPYSLYDISVAAKGFFNARSVDVPVFSGITSIQDFSMIPVPLNMHEDDETLTIYNQEPFYGNSGEV